MHEAPHSNPSALLGRRLGEFELREKIGEGGFGAIYRAEQVGLEREAVVKILRTDLAADEKKQLRFLREAKLASSLDHPYAAHVYAFGAEPDGVLWIAMELVRGTPLSETLRDAPMPLRTFVPFLERLCEVVETAHERGIVHRDIKPQNVMVIARAGTLLPKLLDLGIAKDAAGVVPAPETPASLLGMAALRRFMLASAIAPSGNGYASADAPALTTVKRLRNPDAASSAETAVPEERLGSAPRASTPSLRSAPSTLTGQGDLMGSPSYMAPEQWVSGDLVTRQCDIYALSLHPRLREAIAGRFGRFPGASPRTCARQHLTGARSTAPGESSERPHRGSRPRDGGRTPIDRQQGERPRSSPFARASSGALLEGLAPTLRSCRGSRATPPRSRSGSTRSRWPRRSRS